MSTTTTAASTTGNKYPGITSPISLAAPTPQDLTFTSSLVEYLHETGVFETEAESEQRELVLGRLNLLVREFVIEVGRQKGLPESLLAESGGRIFTFGSYRLGVHGRGADIDTLCVAPQHVDRTDFFGYFQEMLKKHPDVQELTSVPDAYVPVMKMRFGGISIDLVFARLSLPSLPVNLDLLEHNLLKNLDDKCILSLNGSRTTDEILRLVPSVETFHTALRGIKLWAKRRGLYSNAMGYLGGVACALLTARICQLYPHAAASTIVGRFFRIYRQWDWPRPVYLKPIEDLQMGQRVWNPRVHPSDRYHRMPVITPAYPSMCSTHNVSASTQSLMMTEFERGAEVTLRIEQGRGSWEELFEESDFFVRHRHFFQLIAVCSTETAYRAWAGYVESRIRHLVSKLELEYMIAGAPPFPQTFEVCVENCASSDEVLEMHKKSDSEPGEREKTGDKSFYSAAFYIALLIAPPSSSDAARQAGPRKLILDRPVAEFRQQLFTWDKIEPEMQLIIRDIRRDALPDYVFGKRGRPPPLSIRKKLEPDQHAVPIPPTNISRNPDYYDHQSSSAEIRQPYENVLATSIRRAESSYANQMHRERSNSAPSTEAKKSRSIEDEHHLRTTTNNAPSGSLRSSSYRRM